MSHKTAASVAHTIGIDTGKNTLHLIGLDDKGAIVMREKVARGHRSRRRSPSSETMMWSKHSRRINPYQPFGKAILPARGRCMATSCYRSRT
jgi:hypothetical protein